MNWLAVYATNQWSLAERWILNGGARLNQVGLKSMFVSKEFYPFPFDNAAQSTTALTGNMGLVWLPTRQAKFSLLSSTGFRAPNVDDMGKVFDSQPGLLVVPNPDLKPEYSYNLEFSAEKRIGKVLKLNGTVFNSWLRDALVLAPYTLNGQSSIQFEGQTSIITANQNQQKAYVRGINLEANAYLSGGWRLQGTYTNTIGCIVEENGTTSPLDHIPPVYGKLSAQWKYKHLQTEFFSLYNGWKRIKDYRLNAEDNESGATPEGMPAWYTLNLRTSYALNKYLMVQVAAENLLDTNYRTFASGVSAPSRNFIIAIRGSF
jgi:hemoglobin/transferrin/lactoferrin receptor protein